MYERPTKIEVQPNKFVYTGKSTCPKKYREAFVNGFNRRQENNPHGFRKRKTMDNNWDEITIDHPTKAREEWSRWYTKGAEVRALADEQERRGVDMNVFYSATG